MRGQPVPHANPKQVRLAVMGFDTVVAERKLNPVRPEPKAVVAQSPG
jgi:hypothetical protein